MSKTRRRRTRLVLALCGAGALFLSIAAASSWSFLLERWYLYQLSWEDVEAQDRACLALADLGSERAVPTMVELLEERPGSSVSLPAPGRALVSLGAASVPAVLDGFERSKEIRFYEPGPVKNALRRVVREIGDSAVAGLIAALTPERPKLVGEVVELLEALGSQARPALVPLVLVAAPRVDVSELLSLILSDFPSDARRLLRVDLFQSRKSVAAIEAAFVRSFLARGVRPDHLDFLDLWVREDPRAIASVIEIAASCFGSSALQNMPERHRAYEWHRRVFDLARGNDKYESRLIVASYRSKHLSTLALPFVERQLRSQETLRVRTGLRHLSKLRFEGNEDVFDRSLLRTLTKHEDGEVRLSAGELLVRGSQEAESVAALCRLLTDPETEVRVKIALLVLERNISLCRNAAEEELFHVLESGSDRTKGQVLKVFDSHRVRDEERFRTRLEKLAAGGSRAETRRLALSLLGKRLEPESMLEFLFRDVEENRFFWAVSAFPELFQIVENIDCCPAKRASFLIDQAEFFSNDYLSAFSKHISTSKLRPEIARVLIEKIRSGQAEGERQGVRILATLMATGKGDRHSFRLSTVYLIALSSMRSRRSARWGRERKMRLRISSAVSGGGL
ncbi:MAG: hypothetical protein AAF517_00615 [Planctomycetota bacterium]